MKTYVVTTGAAFALLVLAHLSRVTLEGWQVAKNPVFAITTLGSVAFCIWALYLLEKLRRG